MSLQGDSITIPIAVMDAPTQRLRPQAFYMTVPDYQRFYDALAASVRASWMNPIQYATARDAWFAAPVGQQSASQAQTLYAQSATVPQSMVSATRPTSLAWLALLAGAAILAYTIWKRGKHDD